MSRAEKRWFKALEEITDPDFIWGALDNVHDAETTLADYAAAVSRAQRAALAASQPAQPVTVKVKPLVWEAVTDDGRIQDALGLNTVYRVWLSTNGISRWQAKYMGEWFFADNPEAAQAAAQADYEARVMAALDVQAMTVQDAQCCMCGKRGLSTAEDGGPECELDDGRWVCSRECYDHAVDGVTVQDAARVPEIAALIEGIEMARRRLETIASDAWHGDARDFKRAIVGVFSEFDAALRAIAEGK